MPGGAGIIIGNGAELIAPITIGNIPKVAGIMPPTLNNSIMLQGLDGAVNYIQVGIAAVAVGAAETLRTKSGIISEGLGTDTTVLGQGARTGVAGNNRAVAIGTLAAATNQAVVIGYNASSAAAGGVSIGYQAGNVLALGLTIGSGAYVQGNAGGAAGIAIGNLANAQCNAAGITLAIGHSSVAREGDTVIGNSATSNAGNAFSNGNVVIGQSAASNKAQGQNVVIGTGAGSSFINTVIVGFNAYCNHDNTIAIGALAHGNAGSSKSILIGQGITATHDSNILLGHGLISAAANYCMIGGPNTDIQTVLIGNGNTAVTPAARTVRFTDASGVDNVAGNLALILPRSTGAAAPATFSIQRGVPGVSSAVSQALETDMVIGATGTVFLGQDALALSTYAPNEVLDSVVASTRLKVHRIGAAASIIMGRANGTFAAPTALVLNDILGLYQWRGFNGVGLISGSSCESLATENWAVGATGSRLDFYVTKNGTTGRIRTLTVENDGSVNITPIAAATPFLRFGNANSQSAVGVQSATLLNLPAAATAGNPNKWLIVDDNGVPGYIPMWH